MSLCGHCSLGINVEGECATCMVCQLSFHYDCSVRESKWRALSQENRAKWTCNKCKNAGSDGLSNANSLCSLKSNESEEVETVKQMFKSINMKLNNLDQRLNTLDELKTNVEDLKNSVEFQSKQYDDMLKEVTELKQDNKRLNDELTTLKTANEKQNDHLNWLSSKFNTLEQYGRGVNLEIHGLEQTAQEDIEDILKKIAAKLNIPYSPTGIQAAHRLPSKYKANRRPESLLIQFVSKKTRNTWLQAGKRLKLISSDIIGKSTAKLFFLENLTPYYRGLLNETKELAGKKGYRFVWVSGGRILVKKEQGDNKTSVITCYSDLNSLS